MGFPLRQAAARFGVGISTAIRWIGRAKLGERSARAQGWRRPSRLDPHESFVYEMIEAQKDITLNEMVVRLASEVGLRIGRSALSIWLGRRGWTFKNVWPAPLAIGYLKALFGRAQTYPA